MQVAKELADMVVFRIFRFQKRKYVVQIMKFT